MGAAPSLSANHAVMEAGYELVSAGDHGRLLPMDTNHLEVIELGNADLMGTGTWTGWDGPRDFAPLPEYPQADALPPRPSKDDSLVETLRRQAKRDAAISTAFDAASLALAAGMALALGGGL